MKGVERTWEDLKGLERTWKDGLETIWKNLKEMKEVQDLEKCDRQTEDRRQKTDGVTDKKIHIFKRKWLISMEGKIINGLPFNSKFSQLNES